MRRLASRSPRSIASRGDFLGGGEQLVAADVGEEELERIARAGRLVGS
jgi:hypothetical protein